MLVLQLHRDIKCLQLTSVISDYKKERIPKHCYQNNYARHNKSSFRTTFMVTSTAIKTTDQLLLL